MSIAINGNFERNQYVASFTGQVNFVYTFPIYSETYLTVYKRAGSDMPDDATQILTLGADYTVTGAGSEAGGTIILTVGATFGDIITIVGTQPIERESVFPDLNPFTVALNQQLNQMTIMMQQNHTYWANLTPHYNFDELVSAPSGADPGVRPFKLILPMLGDGEVWVGRGQQGSIPDDITTAPLPTGGGGGGGGTTTTITQPGQTFVRGDWVRIDTVTQDYVLALADSSKNAEVAGLVKTSNIGAGTFVLQQSGYVPTTDGIFFGLNPGEPQYLSPTVPGAMQNTDVTGAGQVSRPVFLPDASGSSGWILPYRGIIIGGAAGGGGGSSPNNIATVVQPGNTFVVGDALYCSGDDTFSLANGYTNIDEAQAEWVVTSILIANSTFTIQQGGLIQGIIQFDGAGVPIVSGIVYYISPNVGEEGKLSPTEPNAAGQFTKPFYIQQIAATKTGWLLDQRPLPATPAGPPFITATGGVITTNGNQKIHTFLANDNFTITAGSGTVQYLIVGGGGGGGSNNSTITAGAGGGGAGGMLTGTTGTLTVGVFPVVVGAGGLGGAAGGYNQGGDGNVSSFNGNTASGGGGGGGGGGLASAAGRNGASGGGSSASFAPGTGIAGQGNHGGTGNAFGGGGGGGAGAFGANGSGSNGGAGGNGAASAISGAAVTYAAGGGGAAFGANTPGTGGLGGGGMGGTNAAPPTAGTANTGSGGGGCGNLVGAGAAGGSGIVILSYQYM